MSFFGYKNDMDPDDGPLRTSKPYRFIAGFACVYVSLLRCGRGGNWSDIFHGKWVCAFAIFLGYGAVREGKGFINHILFWRHASLSDVNVWYLLLFIFFVAGLLFLNLLHFGWL
jgi:hypothetical protein